jgi:hypothetical protein
MTQQSLQGWTDPTSNSLKLGNPRINMTRIVVVAMD